MIDKFLDKEVNVLKKKNTDVFRSITPQMMLILLAFCEKNIVRYAIIVFSMLPGVGFLSVYILPILYITLILFCIKKITVGLLELIIPIFIVTSLTLTCLIYPVNGQYILDENNFWNTIFPCLRWYIVSLIFIPNKETMDLLGKVSCLAIMIETAFLILYMVPNGLVVQDDMSRAYQLLPNIMIVINYSFNSKRLYAWGFSCIGVMYLLALGTRGPFLILISFTLIKLLRMGAGSIYKKILLILGIGSVCGLLLIPTIYVNILAKISFIFEKIGLSTRIVDHLMTGTVVSYTSGRDDLYEIALQKISERPLLGYGIYGEWEWFHWNAHNMYLELWIHFGVFIGSILLLWGIFLIASTYLKTKNKYTKDMILIFSCFVFLRGIFGGSYLTFGVFFLIGLCVKEKRRIKNHVMQQ